MRNLCNRLYTQKRREWFKKDLLFHSVYKRADLWF